MEFEARFGHDAAAFDEFRPEYPAELFARILESVPADQRRRAMDLGAGTGKSALPLCAWFDEVIAVEPDPEMAARLIGRHSRLVVRNVAAENCSQDTESVDLVTAGTAFHWMDGPQILEKVRQWLRPGGVLAVYSYPFPRLPDPIRSFVDREMEFHWDRFRHQRLRDTDYTRRTVEACTELDQLEELSVPNLLELSPRQLAGFWRSTSYGCAYAKTLPNPEGYWTELENRIRQLTPDSTIAADFSAHLILARKPVK